MNAGTHGRFGPAYFLIANASLDRTSWFEGDGVEAWQWVLPTAAGLSAVFVMGSIIWAVFDVLGADRLDQTTRVIWVLLLFVAPLFGLLAWLYVKPRLTGSADGVRLRKAL